MKKNIQNLLTIFSIVLVTLICSSTLGGSPLDINYKNIVLNVELKNDSIMPCRIGDVVPKITFRNLLNSSSRNVTLQSLRGNHVILDFWATWCIPCVRNFPKIDSIQKKYMNNLKFIMVAGDTDKNVESFLRLKNNLSLTITYTNDTIETYFPKTTVPHYVWIDSKGIIKAVTGEYELTEDNIVKFIHNQPFKFKIKDGIKEKEFTRRYGKLSIDSNHIAMESKLTKSDSTVESGTYLSHIYRYIVCVNRSVIELFKVAFGQGYKRSNIIEDVRDPKLLREHSDKNYASWFDKYGYCYWLVLPQNQSDSTTLYSKMRQDLLFFFPYKVSFTTKQLKSVVLKTIDIAKVASLKSKGEKPYYNSSVYGVSMKNMPIEKILDEFLFYAHKGHYYKDSLLYFIPLIDSTYIKYNIDLELRCNFSNLSELKTALRKKGLDFSEEVIDQPVVLISDR